MPGVLVEIAGPPRSIQTTDDAGEAHFLNLSPGSYTVTASLSGFNTLSQRQHRSPRPAPACR